MIQLIILITNLNQNFNKWKKYTLYVENEKN